MQTQMNIARKQIEHERSLNTQDQQYYLNANTEKLRNEIVYAKTIVGAKFFNEEKWEEANKMANDVLNITDFDGPPLHRLSRILMKAIKAGCHNHIEQSGKPVHLCAGNLYSDHTKPISMIKAYDLLASATPFIKFAYNAINLAILSQSAHANALHIIDIGIGSGHQWSALFAILKGTSFLPTKIRITAIDIPSTEQTLQAVKERLSEEAKELGIEFCFTPLIGKAEEISFTDIEQEKDEFLIVNAVLALHHTPSDDAVIIPERSRDALLSRLRQINPQLLTIVEPDSNHNNLPFKERCHESLQHYLHIFNAFDHLFSRHLQERIILENEFFGRELVNILTADGADRVERHERKEVWSERLQKANFVCLENAFQKGSRTLKNIVPMAAPFEIYQSPHALCLNVDQVPVLAASCWRPI